MKNAVTAIVPVVLVVHVQFAAPPETIAEQRVVPLPFLNAIVPAAALGETVLLRETFFPVVVAVGEAVKVVVVLAVTVKLSTEP